MAKNEKKSSNGWTDKDFTTMYSRIFDLEKDKADEIHDHFGLSVMAILAFLLGLSSFVCLIVFALLNPPQESLESQGFQIECVEYSTIETRVSCTNDAPAVFCAYLGYPTHYEN